ncbi:hypothetical protein GL272_20070 [Aeromonas veronii]|uniref:hypothetical protein n=1 Tax=Aeromonas TaxID=642 RepID=UPI001C5BC82E|nr:MULTISPECIES: hypothetical protein [Aeromonas]MBW3762759.1 hypothetical protein [Aeromonas jandaei]MBW3779174.1 hypothetical protein [Aeromonas veronii]
MKVRQLIAILKKMPQDADLVWQDHDHSENEFNSTIGDVEDVSETKLGEDFGGPVVALRG